jgi:hypothetical protein
MSTMEGIEGRKKYYIFHMVIVLFVLIYLISVVIVANHYSYLSDYLEHDFANIIYQNLDTTGLYLYYSDDNMNYVVYLYGLLFIITLLLLMVSLLMKRSLSTFLLISNYILNYIIIVYVYFSFLNLNGKTSFLTSTHFLLLTSYVNDYSLYIFIPYYGLLIGLTIYFMKKHHLFQNPIAMFR